MLVHQGLSNSCVFCVRIVTSKRVAIPLQLISHSESASDNSNYTLIRHLISVEHSTCFSHHSDRGQVLKICCLAVLARQQPQFHSTFTLPGLWWAHFFSDILDTSGPTLGYHPPSAEQPCSAAYFAPITGSEPRHVAIVL